MPSEPPITTTATITGPGSGRSHLATLPNGKAVTVFPSKQAAALAASLSPGDRVTVELTPFDFTKARIVGRPSD